MADGRTKPTRRGACRATTSTAPCGAVTTAATRDTEVLDHWSTDQAGLPGHARGRHRAGRERRPPLPHRARLEARDRHRAGPGAATPPDPERQADRHRAVRGAARDDWPDYRRGYLCGLIRGDGHLGSYSYDRAGPPAATSTGSGSRSTDLEALRRAHDYLEEEHGVATQEFAFADARPTADAGRSGRSRASNVAAIRELIRWPRTAAPEWCKGFLAGIFDAEGMQQRGAPDLQHRSARSSTGSRGACGGFGFAVRRRGPAAAERPAVRAAAAVACRRQLRFFHTVDPAITRKRDDRGHRAQEPAQPRGRSRSSRSARAAGSTTSRPAPATSSPTASSATTASPAPPTPTSTSTPAATSSARSSSRSTRPRWRGPS